MPSLQIAYEAHEEPVRVLSWSQGSALAENWGQYLISQRQIYCLNEGGPLFVIGGRSRLNLMPGMIGTFRVAEGLRALSSAGFPKKHHFLVIEVCPLWIKKKFAVGLSQIPTNVASQLAEDQIEVALPARLMSNNERNLTRQLNSPPLNGLARDYWFRAKILEFLSLQLFREPESAPFCTQHNQRVTERVAVALALLRENLEEPLDLSGLARKISIAPTSLSRIVSAETGRSLSQHLRSMRIERAAELLKNGRHNVTEAAFEVGYNSLSHFTKAFITEKNQRPSDFLRAAQTGEAG